MRGMGYWFIMLIIAAGILWVMATVGAKIDAQPPASSPVCLHEVIHEGEGRLVIGWTPPSGGVCETLNVKDSTDRDRLQHSTGVAQCEKWVVAALPGFERPVLIQNCDLRSADDGTAVGEER